MFSEKWNNRFLDLAFTTASWSLDPSTKCGAVIVDDFKRVISLGYNGLPDKVFDDPLILNDRPRKYQLVIHAEMNAILNSPVSTRGLHMFVTGPCCDNCAKHVVQAGIASVTWKKPTEDYLSRWAESTAITMETFRLANLPVFELD